MKGNKPSQNSKLITSNVSDGLRDAVDRAAKKMGITRSEYLKYVITKDLERVQNGIDS